MSGSFACSVCGNTHAGLPTDWAVTLPGIIWAMPESRRTRLAKFDSDLCLLGDRHFIRCVLAIPFIDMPGGYGRGVWAAVDRTVIVRYLDLYEWDGSNEPRQVGILANKMIAYDTSLGESVHVHFQDGKTRPSILMPASCTSGLATEQRRGMDAHRYHEVLRANMARGLRQTPTGQE